MPILSPIYSRCPRIAKVDGKLIAATAWHLCVFSLGTFFRKVTVDPMAKEVILHRRYLYLFGKTRRIPFKDILAVTYSYRDWGGPSLLGARDSYDVFSVGLRLMNDDEVHLFYFSGRGGFTNNSPLPDWVYWPEYTFDVSGTQEGASRAYADVLKKLIGVQVMPGRT